MRTDETKSCCSISARMFFKSYCEASVNAINSWTTKALRSAFVGIKSARLHKSERSYCDFISTTTSNFSLSSLLFNVWLNIGSRQPWARPIMLTKTNMEIKAILFMALHFYDFVHDDTLVRVNFQYKNTVWQAADVAFVSVDFYGFQ